MSRAPGSANYRVVVTPTAKSNLVDIADTIAHRDIAAARHFVQALRSKIANLNATPRRCPRAPEDGLAGLEIRNLIHDPYRIIFAIDGTKVIILQVRHGRRLPMNAAAAIADV